MHRGEGLRFAPARQAVADALRQSTDSGNAWALAQRFVAPQLLFDDKPFYIRHVRAQSSFRAPWLRPVWVLPTVNYIYKVTIHSLRCATLRSLQC